MSAAPAEPKRGFWLFYDFVRVTAALPGLLWFRTRLIYENEAARARICGGALLIANHIGFFDPVYLLFAIWYRRVTFVCLQQFFESAAAWFFRAVRCIPIDRQNVGLDSVREIIRRLKAGELVAMFPEGHVNSSGGAPEAFKSGAVLIALRSGRPIVPVYIRPKRRRYERLTLVIGAPLDVKALLGAQQGVAGMDAAAERLLQKENELKHLLERT